MGIADSMKAITEDIVASYDLRVKAIGDLVTDTHSILNDARKTIEGFGKDRKKMSKEQAEELAAYVENLSKSVGDMVEGFRKARTQMSQEQAKALEDFVSSLSKTVSDLRKDANNMVKGFTTDRKRMSKEQAKALADFVTDLSNYVDNLIKGFQANRKELSEELKRMSAYWQSMSATMTAKKGKGIKRQLKVELLENRVLEFIEAHPDGVKVGDMEEPLETPRMALGKIAKKLLEEGKLKKEENLYYPVEE